MRVPFIDSISGAPFICEAEVLDVLHCPRNLGINQEFRGKVSTNLFANEQHVLKIKTPHALAQDKAIAWCRLQLAKERQYGIYLPGRHWLVLENEQGCAVANISPRLQTFDTVLCELLEAGDQIAALQLFSDFFVFYFHSWTGSSLRQDDGLTNYVLQDGKIFYIDDDIYQPDQLVSLAHGIAGLLRRFESIDESLAASIAAALRQQLQRVDPVYPATLDEHLDSVFVPASRAMALTAVRNAMRGFGGAPLARQVAAVVEPEAPKGGRLAIMADIHGNLPALQAVMADMQAEGITQALVLGDIVGYGPHPEACVELVRRQPWLFVRGNHDHALHLGQASERFNRAARWSIDWTLERVSQSTRDWLGTLPFQWRQDDLYAVHGAPADPSFMNAYIYAATAEHNLDKLQEKGVVVCFHGHSHIPGVYYRDRLSVDHYLRQDGIQLRQGERYLVCPGSVGLPRDGSRSAQYAVYDMDARSLVFRELPYDHGSLLEAARRENFPDVMMRVLDRG